MSNNIKLFISFTLNLRRNYVELTQGLVTCVKFTSKLRRNYVGFTSNLRRIYVEIMLLLFLLLLLLLLLFVVFPQKTAIFEGFEQNGRHHASPGEKPLQMVKFSAQTELKSGNSCLALDGWMMDDG